MVKFRKKIFISLTLAIFLFAGGIFAFFLAVRLGLFGPLPGEGELRRLESFTAARILSSDGELLGLYYLQNRTHTVLSKLPGHLTNALIATEDVRFYSHNGIDARGTLRVIVKTLLLGDKSSGGGSTLSQQLAKNLFPRKNYGILTLPVAKFREIIIARRLEEVYSKDELLELYLNTVSFGKNTYGIDIAARMYFSKPSGMLRIEESALLVGLLKAPSAFDPVLTPDAALRRRNVVLHQMSKYNFISEPERDSLQNLPIKLNFARLDHFSGHATYFREYIRNEAEQILTEIEENTGTNYNLYTDGLTIHTTINFDLQKYAELAVRDHLTFLQEEFSHNWAGKEPWRKDPSLAALQITQSKAYQSLLTSGLDHKKALAAMKVPRPSRIFTWQGVRDTVISPLDSVLHHFGMLQCGVVAVDPVSGALLAWVGGDDFGFFKYDHVISRRQAGSTFKPIVYAAALENGIEPCRLYSAETETYRDYNNWTPRNSNNDYEGYYSLQGGLVHSVNTVSVKVMMDAGIEAVTEIAARLGIQSDLPEVPSLALGSGEITLLELTSAYAAFLKQGMPVMPYAIEKITDRNGLVIYQAGQPGDAVPAISPSTAEAITGILEAVVERGTASSLRSRWGLHNALAGKTGTTQDMADGWFIGMTPALVIGTWVGGDNPVVKFRSGNQGYGANSALPVFAQIIGKMNLDPGLLSFMKGNFPVSEDIRESLNCEDFTLRRGLRFNAKPLGKEPIEKKPSSRQPENKKESRAKKFFKKVFGKEN